MAKGKGKKDPFADLPEEFKDKVMGGTAEEIQAEVSKISMAQEELMEAKEEDEDYKQKAAEFTFAGAVYKDGTKANKLKIRFIRQAMKSRGLA